MGPPPWSHLFGPFLPLRTLRILSPSDVIPLTVLFFFYAHSGLEKGSCVTVVSKQDLEMTSVFSGISRDLVDL